MCELLRRLSNAVGNQTSGASTSTHTTQDSVTPNSKVHAAEVNRTSQSISTTISLLSTLCRGSPSITHVNA